MNKNLLPVRRIVGKIDNDFNIDNSDWIPRIAAYTIDALNIINCLPREKRKKTLAVNDRIAVSPCDIDPTSLKIYDSDGCEISELSSNKSCCGNAATSNRFIGVTTDSKEPETHVQLARIVDRSGRNYVISDGNKIELNFDTDEITIESYEILTYFDEYYNCEVPYIYDNGLLIEAITMYCLYRMLGRGYKHQVYDLKANNPAINPYLQWIDLKPKAKAAVQNQIRKSKDNEGWNNFFYNSTFLPRS